MVISFIYTIAEILEKSIYFTAELIAEGKAEAFAYAACSAFGIERESQLYIKNWVEDKHSLQEVMGDISTKVREAFKDLQLNELAQEHSQELNQNQEQTTEMVA